MKYFKDGEGLVYFGNRLRNLRKQRGLTQSELAFLCGFGQNQITNIERGETNTSLSIIFLIARRMDIPLRDLFDFELPPLPQSDQLQ
ncbi:helix-turn-helix domain-containing protein [Spirosoma oryzae]|uniref:helix-turn-helix domain-containing protein n=1 Tax=Spirosoma oryzae TaxID=1469603 RepID=UPI001B80B629